MTRRSLVLLFVLALPSPGEGQAILNVESLQGEEVEGFHGELATRFRLASGNTDITQVGGELGIGHLAQHHWFRAYAGMDQLEKSGKDILDNRYLHLRYNYRFTERFRSFHFYQLQSSQNLLIDRRQIIGSGLRYRLLEGTNSRLEVGGGAMFETERLNSAKLGPDEESETEALRMSNLVVGSGSFGEGRRWVAVVYYQPEVGNFGDYRLSGEAGLDIELLSSLDLDIAFTWRHDSRAPASLEKDDLGLRTGFRYRIR
jgi:putative salt-induced outer membrane protein YdiY